MDNEALISMHYIGVIYTLSMCVLIPLYIYYRTHKRDLVDMRHAWILGLIIMLTILTITFEGGIAAQL